MHSSLGLGFIAISFFLLALVNIYTPHYPRIINYGIPAFLFFIGMLSLEPFFKKTHKMHIAKLAQMIGNSSYSLYLFHIFSLVVAAIILDRMGVTEYGYLFLVLLVVSSIIAGQLCYLIFEKNLTRFVKNTPIKRFLYRKP